MSTKAKKGPGPGPNWKTGLTPEQIEATSKAIRRGVKILVGTVGTGVGAIASRMKPEARLEQKGLRQQARASRKEKRAENLMEKASMAAPKAAARKTKRATGLTQKAKGLRTMSQANLKASEEIYKAKAKK